MQTMEEAGVGGYEVPGVSHSKTLTLLKVHLTSHVASTAEGVPSRWRKGVTRKGDLGG